MKRLLFVPFMALIVLAGCSGEDETPDYVAESEGTYTYTLSGTLVADANQTFTDNGTLKVEKTGGTSVRLTFDAGTNEEVVITTSKIEVASNGYGFNVTSATDSDSEGDAVQYKGEASFAIDGTDYHGAYDTGRKQIEILLLVDYVNNDFDQYNTRLEILASKQ